MQSTITRLALFQFLAIIYATLFNGVVLKINFGSPAPPIFATHLRDYGFLLLLLPAAWLVFASVEAHRPLVNTGDGGEILLSGIILVVGLVVLGFIGTMSASRTHLVYSIRVDDSTSVVHRPKKTNAVLHRVPEEGGSDSTAP